MTGQKNVEHLPPLRGEAKTKGLAARLHAVDGIVSAVPVVMVGVAEQERGPCRPRVTLI